MASSINASLTAGLVSTADTTGDLNLQSGGTTRLAVTSTGVAVTGTLSASGAITGTSLAGALNGSLGATTPSTIVATNVNTPNTFGFKNRIINGAMVIDQRNAGASFTQTTTTTYTLDRYAVYGTVTSKFSVQQSSTAPAGFSKSMLLTSLSAYTLGASNIYYMRQIIEGQNIYDLGWGTANAQSVTLSFWARSSLTGTFSGAVANGAHDRSYPFTFTINSANTWEQKTITIAGDTSGTWATDNTSGLQLFFNLGANVLVGPAGAWAGTTYIGASGSISLVSTNAATLYITGVQLEKGSTATSFDVRDYGRELIMCQRYFQKLGNASLVTIGAGFQQVTTTALYYVKYTTTTRASPTFAFSNLIVTDRTSFDRAVATIANTAAGLDSTYISVTNAAGGSINQPVFLSVATGTTGFLSLDSEL